MPVERFACFSEAQRIVSRDGHIEVAKAYYSVPPEYLGHTVWARTLDVRLQEAAGNQLSHAEFLELILQDEVLVRQERFIGRRVKGAQFRELKTQLGEVRRSSMRTTPSA